MATFYSILKKEGDDLVIYRSEKEFPKLYTGEDSDLTESKSDHDLQIAFWFSSSDRIKVAEGEFGKFLQFQTFGLDLTTGIEIPESCYEVREKAGVYGMTKKGNQYFPGEKLAYFKDGRASEKETGIPKGPTGDRCSECDKHPGCCFVGQCHAKSQNLPHENTSLDPKEHAIQFTRWLIERNYLRRNCIPYSSEQLYNQFINRK